MDQHHRAAHHEREYFCNEIEWCVIQTGRGRRSITPVCTPPVGLDPPHRPATFQAMSCPAPLNELIDLFEALPEPERRENLINFAEAAKSFAPTDGERFDLTDIRKDEECTDTVGVFLRIEEGDRAHFAIELGPKVQTLTRAMAAVLCKGLNGARLQEVLDVPAGFVPRIIGAELVRLRSRTVYYVLNRMKKAVMMFMYRQNGGEAA